MKEEKQNINVVLWSGGKDSTATIILAHELGIKIDLIIMSLVWFDKKRRIYAENAEHLKWVFQYAKPMFEKWGYKVEFVSSEKDYLYYFYFIREKSKYPENIGKYYGFPFGGFCRIQRLKVEPCEQKLRELKKQNNVTEYVGICFDEEKRIEKMEKRAEQRSILAEQQKTQADAKELCKKYLLLSPNYRNGRKIRGCWFCPNQPISELAELKQAEPDKWNELEKLSKVKNTISRGFSYGKTFEEISIKVDEYIKNPPPKQISLFEGAEYDN